jgi:hypothetical protein
MAWLPTSMDVTTGFRAAMMDVATRFNAATMDATNPGDD